MASAKHNSTMDKAIGLVFFSMLDITSSQGVHLWYVQYMYQGLSLMQCVNCADSVIQLPLTLSCFSPTFSDKGRPW